MKSLSEVQRHQAAIEWNHPLDYPGAGLLPDLVAARAAERPGAVALAAGSERIRYGELEARAWKLAVRLRKLGVGPETIVGVLLERSPDAVAALLAIWKCGAAYLPLDPEHPAERMADILRDGLQGPGPRLVVTTAALAARLPAGAADLLPLDALAGEPEAAGPSRPWPVLLPGHPAYVIYTSGSTGHPKGIVVSHGALANRILWACAAELGADDVFLHKTTLTFDVSLPEMFAPLVAGGRCVLAPPGGQRDLAALAGLIAAESVTHASFPPSALRLLLEVPDAASRLASLRVLITGGETVPPDLAARVRAVAPTATLYNRYGPTETTISVLTGACDPDSREAVMPLGRPIARARVYVLDERMRLTAPLEAGEIYIGGVCLARGYLGRPDLTADRFVPDPVGGEPGERLYRTGDRARWRHDGALEFLGRVDQQVKIRGFRVEIEEVEAVLNSHPQVREAAVVAREEADTGSRRLVAWVIPESGGFCDAGELRRFLARRLADYMIPSAFIPCTDLPRTLSGKVDRSALSEDAGLEGSHEVPATAPRTALESTLCDCLRRLLQTPRIGIDDDFFELGCHSLLLMRLQSRIRETLGIEAPLADIVRNPSVSALASWLETGRRGAEIHPEGLSADAALDPEIQPGADAAAPAERPEAIFLTGATGFLGSHLLAELLDRTDARLLCLVRAADEREGAEALRRGLERYGLWRAEVRERIVPVPGDLARPRLGLSAAAFAALAGGVDAVYHCGAQVNYIYPYEGLRAANVEGTREILRLTVQGRAKTLHHVSSLSVLEQDPRLWAGGAPEEPLTGDASGVTGGYRQSKWVAERLVQTAIERGVPATIHRPGWITGSRAGATNLADLLIRLGVGSLHAGLAPELGPVEVCPTPVDWVSAGIARLSLRPASRGRIFHLINPRPIALESVLELLRGLGYPLRKTPVQLWAATLAELAESGRCELLAPLAGSLRRLAAEAIEGNGGRGFQPPRFSSAETQAALEDDCPAVDRHLLGVYLAALVEAGYLDGALGGGSTMVTSSTRPPGVDVCGLLRGDMCM